MPSQAQTKYLAFCLELCCPVPLPSAEHRDPDGYLISEELALPLVIDLEPLSKALRSRLEDIILEPRSRGKDDRQVLIDLVPNRWESRFVTLRCLADLVNREPVTLQDQYIK